MILVMKTPSVNTWPRKLSKLGVNRKGTVSLDAKIGACPATPTIKKSKSDGFALVRITITWEELAHDKLAC